MSVNPIDSLPNGRDVLLGANIFIYAFGGTSQQCLNLLRRCAREETFGITTVEIINEVSHRMMLAEAVNKGIITKEQAHLLKGKQNQIRGPRDYWIQTSKIFNLNILLLDLDETRVRHGQTMRARYGLLTNDSVLLATADMYGIDCLASRDDDFDSVPDFNIYKPTDV